MCCHKVNSFKWPLGGFGTSFQLTWPPFPTHKNCLIHVKTLGPAGQKKKYYFECPWRAVQVPSLSYENLLLNLSRRIKCNSPNPRAAPLHEKKKQKELEQEKQLTVTFAAVSRSQGHIETHVDVLRLSPALVSASQLINFLSSYLVIVFYELRQLHAHRQAEAVDPIHKSM